MPLRSLTIVVEEYEKAEAAGQPKAAPITKAAVQSIKLMEQTKTDNRGLFAAMYGGGK